MSAPSPRFYNKTSEDLTHLDGACSGGQPLASLSDAMVSAGFCPQCAPGWRLITTPNAADPEYDDISIDADGVVVSLLVGDKLTAAYYAALDPEVEAAVEAATAVAVAGLLALANAQPLDRSVLDANMPDWKPLTKDEVAELHAIQARRMAWLAATVAEGSWD